MLCTRTECLFSKQHYMGKQRNYISRPLRVWHIFCMDPCLQDLLRICQIDYCTDFFGKKQTNKQISDIKIFKEGKKIQLFSHNIIFKRQRSLQYKVKKVKLDCNQTIRKQKKTFLTTLLHLFLILFFSVEPFE